MAEKRSSPAPVGNKTDTASRSPHINSRRARPIDITARRKQ